MAGHEYASNLARKKQKFDNSIGGAFFIENA
jgi:hypothetical protein